MPCRALGAFGLQITVQYDGGTVSLNALSGIGCVRTRAGRLRLGCVPLRLNALSGIGCVRTHYSSATHACPSQEVLMPCRALGAFGPSPRWVGSGPPLRGGLNALSGIGCVRTLRWAADWLNRNRIRLNALSGIGCVRTQMARDLGVTGMLRLNALSGIGCVRTMNGCWQWHHQRPES